MWDWIQRTIDIWPTFFVNGFVDYLNDTMLAPAMSRMFGYPGGYVANGISFAARKSATETSYFHGSGFSLGGLFSGNPTGSSGPKA
jgi:hypothetical protein